METFPQLNLSDLSAAASRHGYEEEVWKRREIKRNKKHAGPKQAPKMSALSCSSILLWPWGYLSYHVRLYSARHFHSFGLNYVWCFSLGGILPQANVPQFLKNSSKVVLICFDVFWCGKELLCVSDKGGCVGLCLPIAVILIIALSGPFKTMPS